MEFGGTPYAGAPFSAMEMGDYQILLQLYLLFPDVSLVFYGEIGDVVILPPDIEIPPPHNMQERRSPCLVYANEDM